MGRKMEKGKRKRIREGKGEEKGKGRKGKEEGEGRGEGKGKEDSLRKVGQTDGRTHGHSGDFILCPMLCIALDRQLQFQRTILLVT